MLGANMRADTDPLNNNNYASTENLFGLFVGAGSEPPDGQRALSDAGRARAARPRLLSVVDQADMAEIRDGYKAYVAKLFTLAGMSDAAGARRPHRSRWR